MSGARHTYQPGERVRYFRRVGGGGDYRKPTDVLEAEVVKLSGSQSVRIRYTDPATGAAVEKVVRRANIEPLSPGG